MESEIMEWFDIFMGILTIDFTVLIAVICYGILTGVVV